MEGREKVFCSKCKDDPTCEDPYQEAAKKMYVATFPRILVIQLKRWNGTGMHAKLTDHIGIPIGPLTVQELFAKTPDMRVDYSGQELYTQDELNTKYTLVGVIMHSGGEGGGHYYAYCRHPYYDSGNDMYKSWYCLNDTSSTTRTEEEVTGALQARADEPYFLFYHKCK
jgi:ubiquitin C-terminal hydrolase